MSYTTCPTRCPLCNYRVVYHIKRDGSPYLRCLNGDCIWRKWDVPDTVMKNYDAYISDYEYELIEKFHQMDD